MPQFEMLDPAIKELTHIIFDLEHQVKVVHADRVDGWGFAPRAEMSNTGRGPKVVRLVTGALPKGVSKKATFHKGTG
ncbi:hypothetical protein CYMTET_48836 [Cymbomonas tetramitiformis]|uniref:Uncharacterized protein n=1 Tax=Cymbomonas tetramitiformis TaxID=36881 RepID=A0AAE0BRE4_9CHLO|nr:hypothetical protein CYMTET_48836 [Cymbomonas tetramitiformis]